MFDGQAHCGTKSDPLRVAFLLIKGLELVDK